MQYTKIAIIIDNFVVKIEKNSIKLNNYSAVMHTLFKLLK